MRALTKDSQRAGAIIWAAGLRQAGLVALGLAVGLWMLSISLLPLTPSAYADEPAQAEASADEDEQRDDASEED